MQWPDPILSLLISSNVNLLDLHIGRVVNTYIGRLLSKAGHNVGLPALVCSPKALCAILCAPGAAVDADHTHPPGTATGLISAEPAVELVCQTVYY